MKLYAEQTDARSTQSLTQNLARFANHFGGAHDINRERGIAFGEPEMIYAVNRVWQQVNTNHLRGSLNSNASSRFYVRGMNVAASY